MADRFEGYASYDGKLWSGPPPPDWWQASDGKWYPPRMALSANPDPPAQQQPAQSGGCGPSLAVLVIGVLVLIVVAAIATSDDDEPSRRSERATEPTMFQELVEPYRNLGCEGTGSRSRLVLYVDGSNDKCTIAALLTVDVLSIPMPESDPDLGPLGVMGTYRGPDYQVVVGPSVDPPGLAFTFTER